MFLDSLALSPRHPPLLPQPSQHLFETETLLTVCQSQQIHLSWGCAMIQRGSPWLLSAASAREAPRLAEVTLTPISTTCLHLPKRTRRALSVGTLELMVVFCSSYRESSQVSLMTPAPGMGAEPHVTDKEGSSSRSGFLLALCRRGRGGCEGSPCYLVSLVV